MSKFYITNAIPYVNAKPHIGHALEFIQSDVIARYHRLRGDDVKFLCGGDENALKNVQAAQKAEKEVQKFIDENSQSFYDLSKKLDITFDVWQKGSDAKHHSSSQKLWQLCS
ncbi:MAG: class I tRNA ligase family protein, partial [Patescibacteria group bacterium]